MGVILFRDDLVKFQLKYKWLAGLVELMFKVLKINLLKMGQNPSNRFVSEVPLFKTGCSH